MDDLYKSLEQYFKILERTGYLSTASVNRLLAYSIIQEFFEEPLYYYLTEEDYQYLLMIIVGEAQNYMVKIV